MIDKPNCFIKYFVFPLILYIVFSYLSSSLNMFFYGNRTTFIVWTSIFYLVLLFVLFYIFKQSIFYRNDFVEKLNISKFHYIIPLAFAICLIFNLILNITNILPNDKLANELNEAINSLNPYFSFASMVLLFPFIEELIFRGFFYKTLLYNTNNEILAIVISSLLFALFHGNISQGIYAFFSGIFLCLVYKYFNNLLYNYFMHSFMNFVSLFFVSYVLELKIKNQIYILFISFFLFLTIIYRIFLYLKINGEK